MNTHLEILVKELIKNGVSAKCCEIITDNEGNVSASEPFLDFSEHDKKVAEEKDRKIAELERDLNKLTNDLKQNIGKINALREENKELKSQKKHIYIVGKEIDGQTYVKFEDFMSVVEELQESLVDSK